MFISAPLELQIHHFVNELNDLVSIQGKPLTDPEVLHISMQLDILILKAMHSQKKSFQQCEAS